jgi:hypothetical protein
VFDKIAKQSPDPEKVKTSDLKYLLASLGNEPTLKEVEEAEVALGADAATGVMSSSSSSMLLLLMFLVGC